MEPRNTKIPTTIRYSSASEGAVQHKKRAISPTIFWSLDRYASDHWIDKIRFACKVTRTGSKPVPAPTSPPRYSFPRSHPEKLDLIACFSCLDSRVLQTPEAPIFLKCASDGAES